MGITNVDINREIMGRSLNTGANCNNKGESWGPWATRSTELRESMGHDMAHLMYVLRPTEYTSGNMARELWGFIYAT